VPPLRADGRRPDQLRPLTFQRGFTGNAPGSVLVKMGRTTVLCTCTVEPTVPPFLLGTGKGWLTAEYSMLPGSTQTRKPRDKGGKVDGRSVEIQRLIGRALRAVVDLGKLGERTLWIDCDVLEADGGTRTASINGAYVALIDALTAAHAVPPPAARSPGASPPGSPVPFPAPGEVVRDSVAAVSIGLLDGAVLLDLPYGEDRDADVDLNLVMTGAGEFIEVQAGGEEATFRRDQLDRLLELGAQGIAAIAARQREALGAAWPLGEPGA
jgi:ribonuclease PH